MVSKFYDVKCECGNVKRVFSHSTMDIKCDKCDKTIVHSRGGKAIIKGEIIKEYG